MFTNFRELFKLSCQLARKCEFHSYFFNRKELIDLKCDFFTKCQKLNFHTDTPRNKHSNILEYRKSQRDATSKILIRESFEGDIASKRKEGYFPTVNLPNTAFNGILYKDLPIVYIKVSRNNTIMTLSDKGITKLTRSCGAEGFKNTRKGTNVAAQTTGTSFGMKAVKRGIKAVRVLLSGLGPGRLSSIKGLQLGGLDIVSITDNTTDFTSLRPRKQRKL